jgi:opacity protein-like surface antigen
MEANVTRAVRTCCAVLCLALYCAVASSAQDSSAENLRGDSSTLEFKDDAARKFLSREAAEFDQWEPLVEEETCEDNKVKWNDPSVKPIDWMRHFGLRHSSSDGRYIGKGVPLEGSSWLNRPFHADWFVGTLIGDDLTQTANLENEVVAGFRVGYDFDYFWGLDWRFSWSNPNIGLDGSDVMSRNGSYFASDVNLKYYPWGDSKVRPFWSLGTGMMHLEYVDLIGISENVTLVTMPVGVGVEFPQFPWLAWRLEMLDNIAFGADGVETLNNFSFIAGMEWRFGAKPNSYWPWRPARNMW